jgi:hypothetical protein
MPSKWDDYAYGYERWGYRSAGRYDRYESYSVCPLGCLPCGTQYGGTGQHSRQCCNGGNCSGSSKGQLSEIQNYYDRFFGEKGKPSKEDKIVAPPKVEPPKEKKPRVEHITRDQQTKESEKVHERIRKVAGGLED